MCYPRGRTLKVVRINTIIIYSDLFAEMPPKVHRGTSSVTRKSSRQSNYVKLAYFDTVHLYMADVFKANKL